MRIIVPGEIPNRELYQILIASVAPRPIALVSTISKDGQVNLAPYSFFNVFSVDPPVAIFSTARRGPDFSYKDTLNNIREQGECVINVVNYSMSRQMALSSCAFPPEQSEFKASGLSPIASDLVQAFRVAESPVQFECRLREIISLGPAEKANQLVLCDIIQIHVKEDLFNDRNRIDPHKLDAMGRLGRSYYVRASGEAIHTIVQRQTPLPIGYMALPDSARQSKILSANDLGQLAGLTQLPSSDVIMKIKQDQLIQTLLEDEKIAVDKLHKRAHRLLAQEKTEEAGVLIWLAEELSINAHD